MITTEKDRFLKQVANGTKSINLEQRAKNKAVKNAPSEPWQRAIWEGETRERYNPETRHFDIVSAGTIFPPGKNDTKMILCRKCKRFTPPHNVILGKFCEDCAAEITEDCPYRSASIIQIHELPQAIRARIRGSR